MSHIRIGRARVFFTAAAAAMGALAAPPARAGDVVRLLPNGQLDSTFNGNGIVANTGGPGFSARVEVFSGGKPIVGGFFNAADHHEYGYVSRYNPDGTGDPNFGFGGFTVADFPAADKQVHVVDLQSSAKIVAGGSAIFSDGTHGFVLWRFNTDGTLDSTFGSGGTVHAFTSDSGVLNAMRVLPDDRILAVGTSAHGARMAAALFTQDGKLDTTFNGTGTLEIKSFTGQGWGADYDGSNFLIVGANFSDPNTTMSAVRVTNRGVLDQSFNGTGILPIDFPGFLNEKAFAVRCWPQNGCFVAGAVNAQTGSDKMAIVHLTPAGAVDGTFGYKTVSFGSGWTTSSATSIAITNDKKLIVSGWAQGASGVAMVAAKYTFAGAVDKTFNGNGQVVVPSSLSSFLVGSGLDPTTGNLVLCD